MAKKKTDEQGADAQALTFEGALARLEEIVAEMEGGTVSLEEMMARFEEGQKLVAFCSGKLNEIERKVEILVKKGETVTAEPFEPEAGGADESPAKKADSPF